MPNWLGGRVTRPRGIRILFLLSFVLHPLSSSFLSYFFCLFVLFFFLSFSSFFPSNYFFWATVIWLLSFSFLLFEIRHHWYFSLFSCYYYHHHLFYLLFYYFLFTIFHIWIYPKAAAGKISPNSLVDIAATHCLQGPNRPWTKLISPVLNCIVLNTRRKIKVEP